VGAAALAAERRSLVRRARARQGVSLTVRNARNRHVDVAAVERALRELEIRWPVVVIFTALLEATGMHRIKDGRHEILLLNTPNRSSRFLSQTFWHEVTHALQREYWSTGEFYRAYTSRRGRDDIENEAWELGRRFLNRYGEVIS
jgi:hypothetical protein